MFAKFDENPAVTLRVIKETKHYGRTHARTDGPTDNVKTVYPPQTKFAGGITTNKVCGGYNNIIIIVLGDQKNRLILLSNHIICFGREKRKLIFCYTLITVQNQGKHIIFHSIFMIHLNCAY